MLTFSILTIFFVLTVAERVRYDNYKVFRINPQTIEQNNVVHDLLKSPDDGITFWNGPGHVNTTSDVMVAPGKLTNFLDLMDRTGTYYFTYIDNVQELIENENPQQNNRTARQVHQFNWRRYQTLEEIYQWLHSLEALYPNNVEVIIGGRTYEGRAIKGVKVSFKANNPGIFLEGNIHAREWISSATVTYILNELLTSTNPQVRQLAESNDWYIFPVVNPDGFVYTHTHERLWRKTRKPSYVYGCVGADPNRNWGFKWNQGGTNGWPCSDIYAGSAAFSEIETQTLSQYIASISNKFYAYIAFHSFMQLLVIPYGHTTVHLGNYDELHAIGSKAIHALQRRYGTAYRVGNVGELLYVATGSSVDWVKSSFNTPITYTYELRDNGIHGFVLPAQQIIPTGQETMDSLVALFQEARLRGIPRNDRYFYDDNI